MYSKKVFCSVLSVFMAVLMILLSLTLPVSALSLSAANSQDKIDATLKEKIATASPDEKIPVAIWYEDVDQNKIDTLTAKEVGFSEEEIDVDYEMPSTELLASLKAEEAGAVDEMQAYLQRTERQREKERERTDEYIMTRRAFSREKYNEKSAKIVKDIDLEENDIIFKSQYAPLIEIYADSDTILKLESNNNVLSIEYIKQENAENDTTLNREESDDVESIMKSVIGYNDMVSKFGLTGQGVNIGIYETGGNIPSDNTDVPRDQFITIGAVVEQSHVANTASILIGTSRGLSKNAMVYSTNSTKQYIEAMITTYNIKLLNVSFAAGSNTEDWSNHLVAYHSVTIIASAGNISQSGIYVVNPARYNNIIAVGGYSISETYDLTDDLMINSSYEELSNGVSKPDVVMPLDIAGGGTSSAAPVLTACIALMYELKSSLAIHPQAVKAIVLASCDRKVNSSSDGEPQETMDAGITERQGAGAPNIWNMACIVSNGTYGVGTINPYSTQGIRRFILPSYDSTHANVSITWITENLHAEDYSSTNQSITAASNVNLNLGVYNGIQNKQLVKSSNLENSSTEMVYFELGNDFNYELRITKATSSDIPIRYGFAYSLDSPEVYRESGNELCYIRNYYYDTYLTLNQITGETSLQPFDGSAEQKWVIKKTGLNTYKLIPGCCQDSLSTSELTFGDSINSSTYKAATKYSLAEGTSVEMEFQILSNESGIDMYDGAVAFFYPDPERQSNNYILTCSNGAGAFARCSMDDQINKYRSWVIEKANYKQCDVDTNGTISIKDATAIQKHIADNQKLYNLGYALADANYDGVVNVRDATTIGEMIADIQ